MEVVVCEFYSKHNANFAIILPSLFSSSTLTDHLSAIIGKSQKLMRDYATEHLTQVYKVSEDVSKKLSYSCVSQRDIQVSSHAVRILYDMHTIKRALQLIHFFC